jgi:hypothetical protein
MCVSRLAPNTLASIFGKTHSVKLPLLYRMTSVLLVLFAIGHTLGFRQVDPSWGVDSLISALKSTHFAVQGVDRSYWDFYTGFGLFVTVFLLFTAVLTWQLGRLPKESLSTMWILNWSLATSFLAVSILSFVYFFPVPMVFSAVIALCLVSAAWLAGKP